MGKKKNKKKNRLKKKDSYTKKEFCDIICANCRACDHVNPSFCFDFYKRDPKYFSAIMMRAMVGVRSCPSYVDHRDFSMLDFSNTFCESGLCDYPSKDGGASCPVFMECYSGFRKQARNQCRGKGNKKKKNGNKKPYVCAPYPTFIVSDNKDWKRRIFDMLYGNEEDGTSDKNRDFQHDTREGKTIKETKRSNGQTGKATHANQSQV